MPINPISDSFSCPSLFSWSLGVSAVLEYDKNVNEQIEELPKEFKF
jgi:hypothetical protein